MSSEAVAQTLARGAIEQFHDRFGPIERIKEKRKVSFTVKRPLRNGCFTGPMTRTNVPANERLATVRRYRRLFVGCLLVAVTGFLVGDALGYPVAGVGVYWAGVAGMLAVWKGTSLEVFDEREQALDRRASHVTLTLAGIALIVGAPGQVVLAELGYELPLVVEGALWGLTAQFVVFGAVYCWLRFRP
jgi:uncharacterized membrane protein